jgi:hypothetical protein
LLRRARMRKQMAASSIALNVLHEAAIGRIGPYSQGVERTPVAATVLRLLDGQMAARANRRIAKIPSFCAWLGHSGCSSRSDGDGTRAMRSGSSLLSGSCAASGSSLRSAASRGPKKGHAGFRV